MHESIKSPASIPPTAHEVKKKEEELSSKDIALRAGILLTGSAIIVFTIRRVIYDQLKPFLKEHVHVPLSDSEGFALQAGALTGFATAVALKDKKMGRRKMLKLGALSAGAGFIAGTGAAIGSQAVDFVKNEQEPAAPSYPKE